MIGVMEYQTATEENGSLVLPPEVQEELGIPPGTMVRLQVEDAGVRIVAQKRPKISKADAIDRIKAVQDLFAGADYSLEDDLIQMRKEEAEHSLRKYGC